MKISCFVAVGVFACILQKTWGTNKPVCSLPGDPGPCRGYFPRYYYDADTSQCQYFISGGCQANENNFASEAECLAACSDSYYACSLPGDPGPCRGYFPRYYYDADTRQCQDFIFGGCGGNKNNFASEVECLAACSDSYYDCFSPHDHGPCRGFFPRAFYDVNAETCRVFIYGGCGGNQNNFESLQECQSVCSGIASYCFSPPDPGPCRGYIPRAFYDVNAETCRVFIYGGCGGNQNNFESVQECQSVCGGVASWKIVFPTEPPQATALAWREDLRCGEGYNAPNGEVAQCDPNGISPCCSPHKWCGNTAEHCTCEGCIDYSGKMVFPTEPPQAWREDLRCGEGYTAPNGEVAQCDPNGISPCCSTAKWCGNTADHCTCGGCIDYSENSGETVSPTTAHPQATSLGSITMDGSLENSGETVSPTTAPPQATSLGSTTVDGSLENSGDTVFPTTVPPQATSLGSITMDVSLENSGETVSPTTAPPQATSLGSTTVDGSLGNSGEIVSPTTAPPQALALAWREDLRCGEGFNASNGEVAQCDPNGISPCCSMANWCGNTPAHCTCEGCIDYSG